MEQNTDMDPELIEMVIAFIDRQAGRDAPLSIEHESRLRWLLVSDPDFRAFFEGCRDLNEDLDRLFDDVDQVLVPQSLVDMVESLSVDTGALPSNIVPFGRPQNTKAPRRSYGWLAAAASVCLLVCGATALQLKTIYDGEISDVQGKLLSANAAFQQKAAEAEQRDIVEAALKEELDRIVADKAALAVELEQTKASLDEMERTIASLDIDDEHAAFLKAENQALEQKVAAAAESLTALSERLAEKETDLASVKATFEEGRATIAALEGDLSLERDQTARTKRIAGLLWTETERLREKASWMKQVAGYHRGYAGSMREVELAEDKMLRTWLEQMLPGRTFPIPNLSKAGLDFVGGRVFFVDGAPTGQIAYHDPEGQLVGFCFTPIRDDQISPLELTQENDLNVAGWRKAGLQYVLIGWTDLGLLGPVAEQLRQKYGEPI